MISKSIKTRDILKDIYMCFLVVYMIVREIIPLHFLIDNIAVSVFVFLTGFMFVLWDLLTDRECFKGRPADFFTAFLIISVISSIINYKYGITANIKCIAAMVLEYFVFFPMGFKENGKESLKMILNTLIITSFIFLMLSIGMYFFSINYNIFMETQRSQGFYTTWGRLWGVFNDPNLICYISLVSVFASGYFMYTYKKLWAYIFYGINIIINMTFIMLAVSRSALVMLAVVPVLSSTYPLFAYIKTNKKKAFGSIIASVAATAVLLGFYYGLQHGIPYVKAAFLNDIGVSAREKVVTMYDRFYQMCGMEILNIDDNHIIIDPDDSDTELNTKVEVEVIERKDKKDDYSNGRFARWKGGIEIFKTTPIIGTSPRNAIPMAQAKKQDTVMGKYGWVTHCSYLEVLVNTGILGAAVMFGCLIYIAVMFFKTALKKGFEADVYIVFLSFVAIAIGVFFVSDVFFAFTINSLLFFYLLGYIYNWSKTDKDGILYKSFSFIKGVKSK